jgi:hypothetical protein
VVSVTLVLPTRRVRSILGASPDRECNAASKTKREEVKLSPEAIEPSGVKVGGMSKQTLTPTFFALARVAFNAEAMAHVGSPLAGRVVEVKTRLGDASPLAGVEVEIVPRFGSPIGRRWRPSRCPAEAECDLPVSLVPYCSGGYAWWHGLSTSDLQRRSLRSSATAVCTLSSCR